MLLGEPTGETSGSGPVRMDASTMAKCRIAFLDDHPIILLGVAGALSHQHDLEVVGSYTTSAALQAGLREAPADVIVIDYSLGKSELDGAALIRMLCSRFPAARLLVYSSHYEPGTVANALRSGARGFVGKNRDTQQLALAIRAVANGDIYIEPHMSLHLLDTGTEPRRPAGEVDGEAEESTMQGANLSPREREVIRCFLNGMTVGEIARKFDRSIKTISTQKFTAYRKLGVSSDNGLFKIARLLGDL